MKTYVELRTLLRAGVLLLAAITSADASNRSSASVTAVEGYQRIARDLGQRSAKTSRAPTLGVLIYKDQLVHPCPITSPSPSPTTTGTSRNAPTNATATNTVLVELNGLCKQHLKQPAAHAVRTAPTLRIETGTPLILIDPAAVSLSADNTLNPQTQGIAARAVGTRDATHGRYLLIEPDDSIASPEALRHFVLDQDGRFLGISLATESNGRSLRLLLPHEALANNPGTLLKHDGAFPELGQLIESLTLERNREWAAMLQHARRWLRTANGSLDAPLALAVAAAQVGSRHDAIKAYEQVVQRAPSHPQALTHLAPLYAEIGALEAAAETYLKAIDAVADSPVLHRNLGMTMLQLAAFHEAIEHLERATTLDKFDKLAWNALGVAHQALMHAHEAGDAFKRAIELDNAFYGAWLNLAALKHEHGDHTGAHAAYCEAAKRDPSSPTPWFGRGLLYAETGELAREIGAYQRALQIKPDDTKALYNLGKAYLLSGLVLDAIDTYETLRSLEPGHVDTLFNLGLAYFLNGENLKVEQVHMLIRALSRPDAEIFYLRFLAPIDRYLPDKADKARHLLQD